MCSLQKHPAQGGELITEGCHHLRMTPKNAEYKMADSDWQPERCGGVLWQMIKTYDMVTRWMCPTIWWNKKQSHGSSSLSVYLNILSLFSLCGSAQRSFCLTSSVSCTELESPCTSFFHFLRCLTQPNKLPNPWGCSTLLADETFLHNHV